MNLLRQLDHSWAVLRVAKSDRDNYGCHVEIVPTARKHGVSDDDIRHAFENAVAAVAVKDQPDFTMLTGPDQTGRLIEVGVLADDDNDYVIHAMPARPKFLNSIRPHRGDQ